VPAAAPAPPQRRGERVKLSFNEQRELASLPAELEALETEQSALIARMSAAGYHAAGARQMKDDAERTAALERLLEERLARWMALEDKAKAAAQREPDASNDSERRSAARSGRFRRHGSAGMLNLRAALLSVATRQQRRDALVGRRRLGSRHPSAQPLAVQVGEEVEQLLLAERPQFVVGPVEAHRRMEDRRTCTC
jgi:hypothetical protein